MANTKQDYNKNPTMSAKCQHKTQMIRKQNREDDDKKRKKSAEHIKVYDDFDREQAKQMVRRIF